MMNEMGADACRKAETYTIPVGNVCRIAFNSQVEIVCIPPHQLAPGETQLNILVKSLTEAVTGAEILDLFQDNAEVDPEIPSQFLRTQTEETPHPMPLAESPPPRPMMAEDGPPAARGKGSVKETVEYERVAASVGDCGKLKCIFR